jgi:hypothetical protein
VKQLNDETGARTSVSPLDAVSQVTSERIVTISGSLASIEAVFHRLVGLSYREPDQWQWTNRSSRYAVVGAGCGKLCRVHALRAALVCAYHPHLSHRPPHYPLAGNPHSPTTTQVHVRPCAQPRHGLGCRHWFLCDHAARYDGGHVWCPRVCGRGGARGWRSVHRPACLRQRTQRWLWRGAHLWRRRCHVLRRPGGCLRLCPRGLLWYVLGVWNGGECRELVEVWVCP